MNFFSLVDFTILSDFKIALGMIEVQYRQFPGGIEENHEICHSE